MAANTPTGKQGGFAYIFVLMWVALTAAALGAVGEVWHTAQRRDKEAELLYVGGQYRQALERFGASGHFPKSLNELLGDNKTVPPRRYIRRLYPDPMTGNERWGTITTMDGQIVGVYSESREKPLKKTNFDRRNAAFEGASKYSEWVFIAMNAPAQAKANSTFIFGKNQFRLR